MHEHDARRIAQAVSNISHAMTRFATAHERLAKAVEQSKEPAPLYVTYNTCPDCGLGTVTTESGDSHAGT